MQHFLSSMFPFNVHGLPLVFRITRPDNMAPTTRNQNPARRKARKIQHRPRKKNRVEKRSTPSSPQFKIAKSRPRTLSKQALLKKSGLTTVNPKAAESKGSPRMVKYQLSTQWPSSEPFEKVCDLLYADTSAITPLHPTPLRDPIRLLLTCRYQQNCLQRDPLPANYVYVPRGDVYVTRNCRSKTKESQRLVYKVYVRMLSLSLDLPVNLSSQAMAKRSLGQHRKEGTGDPYPGRCLYHCLTIRTRNSRVSG